MVERSGAAGSPLGVAASDWVPAKFDRPPVRTRLHLAALAGYLTAPDVIFLAARSALLDRKPLAAVRIVMRIRRKLIGYPAECSGPPHLLGP
jgi:hypothetical protein